MVDEAHAPRTIYAAWSRPSLVPVVDVIAAGSAAADTAAAVLVTESSAREPVPLRAGVTVAGPSATTPIGAAMSNTRWAGWGAVLGSRTLVRRGWTMEILDTHTHGQKCRPANQREGVNAAVTVMSERSHAKEKIWSDKQQQMDMCITTKHPYTPIHPLSTTKEEERERARACARGRERKSERKKERKKARERESGREGEEEESSMLPQVTHPPSLPDAVWHPSSFGSTRTIREAGPVRELG